MARPPQYPLSDLDSMAVAKVKAALKELSPEGRSYVLKWLVKFYNDGGSMFSPSYTNRRKQVVIDDQAFWLVEIPRSNKP
jgi:hypothetical protein